MIIFWNASAIDFTRAKFSARMLYLNWTGKTIRFRDELWQIISMVVRKHSRGYEELNDWFEQQSDALSFSTDQLIFPQQD
ncbi:hypothetical protein [Nitrosomonas supralitoralis]|uniref:Uncharacterized protein n=1 Tax=Nitrosomonas supralitoralis TaxID=2116706 RepID=A0A2P7NWA8_9PROT|nr:hypothetical protein [Nitrosomonas supralitoralis]PSJ17764.1 hypothetical protein C7H79_06440 [Nitrosomonas supralitoralis]